MLTGTDGMIEHVANVYIETVHVLPFLINYCLVGAD